MFCKAITSTPHAYTPKQYGGLTFHHQMRYNTYESRSGSRPESSVFHRVGYNSVPYRFTSILPIPHTLFFLSACYPRYPFRNTVVARDARGAIDFRSIYLFFPFFSLYPPILSLYFHFFLLLGGKYRKYCIYSKALCFELKFDRLVKPQSVEEV